LENGVLRRMFGPKKDEVAGDGGKYCIMRNLYSSPGIMRMISQKG
jgi:hypothetical protein